MRTSSGNYGMIGWDGTVSSKYSQESSNDMKVLVYGSANIDYSYRVDHIGKVNETISSIDLERHAGGKGANQASAIARSGTNVFFAGRIGRDGIFLGESLEQFGVDTRFLKVVDGTTGHAIIQIDSSGANSILLFPGENRNQQADDIIETLSFFGDGDILLLQNEIDGLDAIIREAHGKDMRIFFNLALFDDSLTELPLSFVDTLIVNEVEGTGLAGLWNPSDRKLLVEGLDAKRGRSSVILTVGKDGSYLISDEGVFHQEALGDKVVDTTAAGDTFIGFYIASLMRGICGPDALYYASKASGIAISRLGAASSIPSGEEVFGH